MSAKKQIKKIIKYLTNKHYRDMININTGKYDNLSDEEYIKLAFKVKIGKEVDLENPKSFSEKLQWLKLFDRKPEYVSMVDKYEVKKIVADKIGEEYIIPTLGVWDNFDEIDVSALPDKFVLKCTHDSGGLVICRDKTKFNIESARKKIQKSLKNNYFYNGREWPYKNVKPRIIAEKYMEDEKTGELRDYKFFCFSGEVKLLIVATDRQTAGEEVKFDFFDSSFNHLEIKNGHPNASKKILPPVNFELMKTLAEKLSKDIPHLRVDFYEVNGKVFFGELTFYHFSGFVPFEPNEWDEKIGEWLILPDKKHE